MSSQTTGHQRPDQTTSNNNDKLHKFFSNLLSLVDGLHLIIRTDRDGVDILRVDTGCCPKVLASPQYQAILATTVDRAGKLGFGPNKHVIARYTNYQVISFNHLPVIVSMVAESSANTGIMLELEKDFRPLVQEMKSCVDFEREVTPDVKSASSRNSNSS